MNSHTTTVCRRCGKGSHSRHLCPTMEAQCFRCNRRGYFSSQCLLTTVASDARNLQELTTETNMTDDSTIKAAYLNTCMVDGSKKVWEIDVNINCKAVTCKVDTGAEETALADSTWESLGNTTPLKSAGLSLFGPVQTPLNLLGKATLHWPTMGILVRKKCLSLERL